MKANTYLYSFHDELLEYKQSKSGQLHANIRHTARFLKDHGQIGGEHYLIIEALLRQPEWIPEKFGVFKGLTTAKLGKT